MKLTLPLSVIILALAHWPARAQSFTNCSTPRNRQTSLTSAPLDPEKGIKAENGYAAGQYIPQVQASHQGMLQSMRPHTPGPLSSPGSTDLSLEGEWSWTAYCNDQKTNVIGGTIQNNSTGTTSGTIKVELFYTTTPYSGGTITGYVLFDHQFAEVIPPGWYYYDINLWSDWVNNPPDGPYYTTLVLAEYNNGQFWLVDWINTGTVDHLCSDGIEENQPAVQVSIYPNPAVDVVHVVLEHDPGVGELVLLDGTGRLVAARPFTGSSGQVDVSALPNGVYSLKIRTAQGIICRKVVKD